MAPKIRAKCRVCEEVESKYVCPKCEIQYCSVKCFKEHKASSCVERVSGTHIRTQDELLPPSISDVTAIRTEQVEGNSGVGVNGTGTVADIGRHSAELTSTRPEGLPLSQPKPLKPLTELKWPYIPDEPSYPDPLKRDDPKPLTLAQYEAIATSPAIRKSLSSNESLHNLLRSLDKLRGNEREMELERLLGVSVDEGRGNFSVRGTASGSMPAGGSRKSTMSADEDSVRALRELAMAIESAVRGDRQDVLGLDWENT